MGHRILCIFMYQEEEEVDIELPLTEEEIQQKYDGKIRKEMSGKTYEVITDLFRGNYNTFFNAMMS